MTFLVKDWDKASVTVSTGAPFIYRFGSVTDDIAALLVSAYFNEVVKDLSIGDLILVKATDDTTFLEVTAVDPDVTTIDFISGGGGGVVTSVNGKTDVVVLSPEDLQVIETLAVSGTLNSATTYVGITGGVAKQITLPSAMVAKDGFMLLIKDEAGTAGANNILVKGFAENIDGSAVGISITVNFGIMRLYARGGQWFTL